MLNVLEAKHLTKKFGDFIAVNDVSFALHEGEILGLLGPNGAGKTTTIQMLLGALTPTSGNVIVFGKPLLQNREEILEQMNFSSTYTNLPWDLTVWENLHFMSYLYIIKNRKARVAQLIEMFKLTDFVKKRISELSAGQVTRVNLAKSFINFPKVLLLDEPTASLDPDIASYIREVILEQRKKLKISIIFTSHNMAEVEEVCDRVVFINHGQVVADDTPENLARTIEYCHIELLIKDNIDKLKDYCKAYGIKFRMQGKHIIIDIKETEIAKFLAILSEKKISYVEISIDKPSLEDFFLQNSSKI